MKSKQIFYLDTLSKFKNKNVYSKMLPIMEKNLPQTFKNVVFLKMSNLCYFIHAGMYPCSIEIYVKIDSMYVS